jgi:exodeoxyribonuclease VII small subunit
MSPAKSKAKPDQPNVDELSYEQALSELEMIVSSLEANKLSLEDSLALFERGQALTKHCTELLDNANLRIKKLSADGLEDVIVED